MTVKVGMRVSARGYGKGTVVRSNGGEGWVVRFDNGREDIVLPHDLWSEDGETYIGG